MFILPLFLKDLFIKYRILDDFFSPTTRRSNCLPMSVGTVKSRLMALMFLLWTMSFSLLRGFVLSILEVHHAIFRHGQIFLHFTSLVSVRALKLHSGGFHQFWKTASHYLFKYYFNPTSLSFFSGTPMNSVMSYQSLSKFPIVSFMFRSPSVFVLHSG